MDKETKVRRSKLATRLSAVGWLVLAVWFAAVVEGAPTPFLTGSFIVGVAVVVWSQAIRQQVRDEYE